MNIYNSIRVGIIILVVNVFYNLNAFGQNASTQLIGEWKFVKRELKKPQDNMPISIQAELFNPYKLIFKKDSLLYYFGDDENMYTLYNYTLKQDVILFSGTPQYIIETLNSDTLKVLSNSLSEQNALLVFKRENK